MGQIDARVRKMTVQDAVAEAITSRIKACHTCPLKLDIMGEIPTGSYLRISMSAVKIRVLCGACNGDRVKPPYKITQYTSCTRFIRSNKK